MKIVILLTIIFLCVSCGKKYSGRIAPKAVNGVLDLSSWDFEKDGPVNLSGEWKFYWKKLINPESIKGKKVPTKDYYLEVPGYWNVLKDPITKKRLSDKGYATYILEIKGIEKGKDLGLLMNPFMSSYKLFKVSRDSVKSIFQSGIVGKSSDSSIPEEKKNKSVLSFNEGSHYFLLQASNYFYRSGLFNSAPRLGTIQDIFYEYEIKFFEDVFTIGVLALMAIYHFGLYSQRRKDLGSLFFGMMCFLYTFRAFQTGYLTSWYFKVPSRFIFELFLKIEYITVFLPPFFAIYYISFLLGISFKYTKKISLYTIIPILLVILFSPVYIFSKLFFLHYIQLIAVGIAISITTEVFKASLRGVKYAKFLFITYLLCFGAIINDILNTMLILQTGYIFTSIWLLFIFVQSYILSTTFSSAFKLAENLSENLVKEVEIKSQQIEGQYKDFKNLLFNLDQGFLIFNKEGIVVTESTEITKDLFLLDPINKKVEDIIQLKVGEKNNFRKWISHVYKGMVPFKDLTPLAPNSFEKIQGKFINLEFKPIFFEKNSKKIDKIMCIATDITETVKFEKEAEIERKKAQRLTNILERPLEFLDLISDADETIKHYTQRLKNSKPDAIFRSFHTLKARFGSFQLSETVHNIHNLENYLNDIEDRWNDEDIKEVWNLIEKIRFDHSEFIRKNRRLLEIANNSINSSEDSVNPNALMKKIENDYKAYHKQFVLRDVSGLLKKFILPTKELAKQQDKPINIKVEETDIFVDPKMYKDCLSSFLHIFRNSIDHGIESREERIAKNKSEISNINISIELSTKKDSFKIKIKDDGKGIDPNVIKKIASTKEKLNHLHLDKLSDRDIIELIFEPGFSSKEEASEVSGRGVGMDAVKTEVSKLGGSIRVMSKVDIGTTFEITLPLFA